MRQRLLGPTGLRVSEICLGTLTFGETKDWGADEDVARQILACFADAGGTFIDTAPNYAGGAAEEIVGAFTQDARDDFVIATKYTAATRRHPLAGGNSRKAMMLSVEASLKRLRTDHIDLLWLHFWDGTTPLDEIMRALDDLTASGKTLYIGFSDAPAWLTARAATLAELRGWNRLAAVQLEYNLSARDAERELLPMADALDLGIVCWGPLAAGALAGGSDPRRRAADALPPLLSEIAAGLRGIAAAHETSSAAIALHWLNHGIGAPRIPLIGARSVTQLSEILVAYGSAPPETALSEADALAPIAPGFPHALIRSPYLRRMALGDPSLHIPPRRNRA